jgi:hypothetical protein
MIGMTKKRQIGEIQKLSKKFSEMCKKLILR